ncbi:MAG: sugar ABC transporter ATP-binding protein [Pirellulaceae bacterium]|nr:sugar ABC transporter ATP-binding protein [Pirellulaceae bacterium]
MTPFDESAPLLEMTDVVKSFPGVRALDGVGLSLHAGEVLALLGENGAGKSTLIKVLGGALSPDAGIIKIRGRQVRISSPQNAQQQGIGIIYQEFNLAPALSARENIFLGQEPSRWGWLPAREEHRQAQRLFERLGVSIDPETRCGRLNVAQQQIVEIAKALALNAKILVMDEPSAALSPREVDSLLRIVDELRSQGLGIIYISHRLDEIFRIADRVTVLRDGGHVGTRPLEELTRESMIEMMVGRTLGNEHPKHAAVLGEVRLEVRNLRRAGAVNDVSFTARSGEILAITGLVGAGRTETVRLVFGADRRDSGEILIDGRAVRIRNPRQAIRSGICLLTEDRKSQGLVLSMTVQENFGLPNSREFAPLGFINAQKESRAFSSFVDQLSIRTSGRRQLAGQLSGGNQQKVVMAKWLQANAEIVIFDEPTRGIDVGAKYEVYLLMNQLAAAGKAVIMISSELPEVLGMADRILVMRGGRVSGEIADVAAATQEQIMSLAVES